MRIKVVPLAISSLLKIKLCVIFSRNGIGLEESELHTLKHLKEEIERERERDRERESDRERDREL